MVSLSSEPRVPRSKKRPSSYFERQVRDGRVWSFSSGVVVWSTKMTKSWCPARCVRRPPPWWWEAAWEVTWEAAWEVTWEAAWEAAWEVT